MNSGDDFSELKFREWLQQSLVRNPNLQPLAEDLQSYTTEKFTGWVQDGLTQIVVEGKSEADAFSPGELIIGVSPNGWRDDFYALVALLEPSVRGALVRGVVDIFKGIAEFQNDDDISANDGRNWERFAVELMRLTRDLRSPLCEIEATPLDTLKKLITVQFPKSRAVLEEGLLLWRAFAQQISKPNEWELVFERHMHFRDEFTPLIAFAHVVRFPEYAQFYLSNWSTYRRYRHDLLSSRNEERVLSGITPETLFIATENVLRHVTDRENRRIRLDATYERATGLNSIPNVTVPTRQPIPQGSKDAWDSPTKSLAPKKNRSRAELDDFVLNPGFSGSPMGVFA